MRFLKPVLLVMLTLFISLTGVLGSVDVLANENLENGIYDVKNDVYHDSDIGMSMARSYLNDTMQLKILGDEIEYTIGFSGTEYMENFRILVDGNEGNAEIVEEDKENGTIKLKVKVPNKDSELEAKIYVGPMERDVQFKVIPKFDTLTLVEKLEAPKVENKESSGENLSYETGKSEDAISKATGLANNKNMVIYIGGGIIIVALIVSLVIAKRKK
ncbi:iron transporter [Clostridium perfringens]|uniref:NEAT domain-containing protein n=1 Tax=Clostridium perfringens TaxID=1502 RepID=UPI000D84E6E5|nr:NEAT domain-containing protein [Clostridium perfringens]MDH5087158.1 Iron Transport-associated domain protein [Clostridium perfringens]SQB35409.1 iron transporter [Clostridium perfringens]